MIIICLWALSSLLVFTVSLDTLQIAKPKWSMPEVLIGSLGIGALGPLYILWYLGKGGMRLVRRLGSGKENNK